MSGLRTAALVSLGLSAATAHLAALERGPGAPRILSPVSATEAVALVGACPTFSWTLAPEAPGYELIVLRAGAHSDGEHPSAPSPPTAEVLEITEIAIRHRLPAGASTWTPDRRECLEAGERYAWSVRALDSEHQVRLGGEAVEELAGEPLTETISGPIEWAEPVWLEVSAEPTLEEVEEAMETLRRWARHRRGEAHGGDDLSATRSATTNAPDRTSRSSQRVGTGRGFATNAESPGNGPARGGAGSDRATGGPGPRALHRTTSGIRVATPAAAPVFGAASLSVSDQVHLGALGDVFKDGELFLWDDTSASNTALGRGALSSVSYFATSNTAVGRGALQNTTGSAMAGGDGSWNTALGDKALYTNTVGRGNTASGFRALFSNLDGDFNTAIGRVALSFNVSGSYNTAVGHETLWQNVSGAGNTAIGEKALRQNYSGNLNTAAGKSALASNSTGARNTAVGYQALLANFNSDENTAVGSYALKLNTGVLNTAVGASALFNNAAASFNTAIGASALFNNTTASFNTATGTSAMFRNTSGDGNTATGAFAMFENTSGAGNTAMGSRALYANETASQNTAFGYKALRLNEAAYNTAMGWNAMDANTTGHSNTAIGSEVMSANTTGFRNVAVGWRALNANTTGDNNVAIGQRAGFNSQLGNDSIFILNTGSSSDSKTIKIGTEGTQTTAFIAGIRGKTTGVANAVNVVIDGNGQLGTISSSRRLKQDVENLAPYVDRLSELRPVSFRYRAQVALDPEASLEFGLIAEEVAEVFPELVVFDDEGHPETVKYRLLSSLLLAESQSLARRQADLERRLDELERTRTRGPR